jgi:hypothetical protein
MEIFSVDDNIGSELDVDTLKDIKADGINIRVGNKIMYLTVTDEVSLPEDDLRKEYEKKLEEAYGDIKSVVNKHKDDLTEAYKIKERELNNKIEEYNRKARSIKSMPEILRNEAAQGLSAAIDDGSNNVIWYFNGVYAPKFINDRRIDPKFAKRLMTPITIAIYTNHDMKVDEIRVLRIIGHDKFYHYHSISRSSDCWGDFKYSGEDVSTAEKAIELAKKALVVLETINEFSLGTQNPRGLSRFNTLKNHLLKKDEVAEEVNNNNSRNSRAGITTDVNNNLAEEANVWSV